MEFINKNKGLVMMVIGLIALVIYNLGNINITNLETPNTLGESLIEVNTTETESLSGEIVIEIKGEVNYPGIYTLPNGSRLGEAISIAGGLTRYADISELNQAIKLSDEQLIMIPTSATETTNIQVEIRGEVKYPGVYILYNNSRVEDLIDKAGGLTTDADINDLSLARILIDGETIQIPKISEASSSTPIMIYVEITGQVINPGVYLIPETYDLEDLINEAGGVTNNCDLTKIIWDLKLLQGSTVHIYSFNEEVVEENSGLININTASLEELDSLPGIGEIIGQRIIDYRNEFGDFEAIEDIMLVNGISYTIYEDIQELITT